MSDPKEQKQTTEVVQKNPLALKEEEILNFWRENKIFEATLEKAAPKGEFCFYDGPPFATGTPHYGHLLAGTIKDVIPRYKTMCGFHVNRKWGWDTHGLPIENIVEKELGLKSKKDIEDYGLKGFNEMARSRVMRYAADWKVVVPRMGRWVDMEKDYKTMDPSFMETVIWVFKSLYDKGLVYEGFKPMHLCPHCGTTLSNFEVAQGYKDITDISVTAKFLLADQSKTYILAWTTTPWTLPGNVALAVNPEIDYVKIKINEEFYILAESRLAVIKEPYEIVEKVIGQNLIGLSYVPVFEYYVSDSSIKNIENGYKIYGADFVTTEDGTGVVHIAPAFGDDDLKLGQKNNLPFIQHVGYDGRFKKEVTDFVGQLVKPIENPQLADIEIIKYLAGKGALYSKEKIIHSYPHCWRCHTPLLNYATSSWFVEVTKFRDDLVKANQSVDWTPNDIRDGRFGKWLEGARDWAISRSRFWGSPLPIWRCKDCEKIEVVGGVDDIKKQTRGTNKYFIARHGEAENNVLGILSCVADRPHHLTEKGREQVRMAAEDLKTKERIDYIYYSPFVRTKETTEIFAKVLGLNKEQLIEENRLHEVNAGILDMKSDAEYQAYFGSREEKFYKTIEGGETHTEVKNRMTSVLYDLAKKYEGKNILFVTHNTPAWLMVAGALGDTPEQAIALRQEREFIHNSEVKLIDFAPIPHNDSYELDFHRPYIDDVTWKCTCSGEMRRVPEVFDCWFESGSMPYAQYHHPFENLDKFNPEKDIGFSADFIAEGLDQTRGWFYSMLVIAVGLFGKSSYKNVVVNGIVLAEDGQKMSKSLKNYPDPMIVVDKYGADALRYYMMSSPVVKAEDLRFSEKGVDEVMKKLIMRLNNVYTFFETYKNDLKSEVFVSENVLDKWVVAKLKELAESMTSSLEKYELDRASRPLLDFVDDLSTWYLRRSRDRFKSEDIQDKQWALQTTKQILLGYVKLLAPFMPFVAENLFQNLRSDKDTKSVHLESWPVLGALAAEEKDLLEKMVEVRKVVTLGLEARAKASLKVRQPLASLSLKDEVLKGKEGLIGLLIDEVNVKEIKFNNVQEVTVVLDTVITPELKKEGVFRDFLRSVQEARKITGLVVSDIVKMQIDTNETGENLIETFKEEISKVANVKEFEFVTLPEVGEIKVEELVFKVKLIKI
ncbi:MAG: class I tRNA ligase family protein [bacterium]